MSGSSKVEEEVGLGRKLDAAATRSDDSYDVIVVGAGLAGLTAAHELHKDGQRVVVLEAQSRVGGRIHTIDFAGGHIDLGAAWIRTLSVVEKRNGWHA